jgi:hypothetical protein
MTKFNGDVASPFDASATPYTMKANARLAVSHSAGVTAGQLRVLDNGKTLKTPALTANAKYRLDVVPKGRQVTIQCDAAGVVHLYVLDQWMRPRLVATATF